MIGGSSARSGSDHNDYSEDDFWQSWNRPNYDQVKARTDPENVLRDLYAKMCRRPRGELGKAGRGG